MAVTLERKEYPLSMRLPEADVAMIDRAAALRGRSRTDFVRDAAVRAAEEVVMENRLIRMRSEEHTSELQSLMRISYAVFCLKKKNKTRLTHKYNLRLNA